LAEYGAFGRQLRILRLVGRTISVSDYSVNGSELLLWQNDSDRIYESHATHVFFGVGNFGFLFYSLDFME